MQSTTARPYFEGIEEKIIEEIEDAESSILIAMAWFTSRKIKSALLDHKLRHPHITVEIILDRNETNASYFYNTADQFRSAGIVIYPEPERMMHHKFAVIDGKKTLMGSYNYSAKAKTNFESMFIYENQQFSSIYTRVFRSISNPQHLDETVKLLWEYPDFARQLLSMYYPFTPLEFIKYKSLLISGDCYTYDNGYRDSLGYEPGYLFNPAVTHVNEPYSEFKKPYSKSAILRWRHNDAEMAIIDSYREFPDEWDKISDDLEQHDEWFKSYYKRLKDSTLTTAEIEKLIQEKVDIVIEDRLWADNFALFINNGHLTSIFNSIARYQAQSIVKF
ncbi:hypothetical protein ASU31_25775 [Pedobacter ginsenosidimutans]|uniref:phospholipase D n=1 Tax=Pedobacter ginsenosidimutans TaxID=687842 RepID=A0A0T5VH89_9SPHI|nr:phospholipase D-like domain-containing protein [Pedobacter ginsenosidimutans]KRT13213.1 hypothetical protein ASU31_25775 [Pedobacter ginsenosidimutans]